MIKLVILKNEIDDSHKKWQLSCENYGNEIQYQVIDISLNDWMEKIKSFSPDILLLKPSGLTAPFKSMYDERLSILVKDLKFKCFPSYNECLIYENKKYFSYWLKANDLDHPKTDVFYLYNEANDFMIKNANFPLVAKANIGASGSGVVILNDLASGVKYIKDTFGGIGAKKRVGPNLKKGKLLIRASKYLFNPKKIFKKFNIYKARAMDIQKDFVLFQEFIPHEYEWRVVRIGNSFFAHKKLLKNKMSSGSLLKEYCNPPLELLDYVKSITDQFNFYSQAIDLFEYNGNYLINEMQCIFGQSDSYQMKVNDEIGRYVFKENSWVFEKGDFNTNESYDLRLSSAIEFYKLDLL